jgi:hypothetical protein
MTVMGGRKRCIRGREVKGMSMTDECVKLVDSMFVKLGKEAVGMGKRDLKAVVNNPSVKSESSHPPILLLLLLAFIPCVYYTTEMVSGVQMA